MKSYAGKTSRGFTLIEVIITVVVLAVLAAMMASYFGTSFYRSSSSIFNLKKSQELNQVMEKISAKYTEIPRWRKSTAYASGMVVLSTAASPNQGRFSSGGGTSGTAEPVWNNIAVGATTSDGSITWTYAGPSPELAYRKWSPNTSYLAGTVIVPQIAHWNGFTYKCVTTSGTSGATEPTWPTAAGATVTDGATLIWTNNGAVQTDLQTLIGPEGQDMDNTFGKYRVIDNHCVRFNASVEALCDTTCGEYGQYLKVTIGFRSDDAGKTAETLTTLFVRR